MLLKAVEEKFCVLIKGSRIAKQEWKILQNSLEGSKDEKDVGIDMLTYQLEATNMNQRESVADFSARINTLACTL